MKEFTKVAVQKNRGWRGLASVRLYDNDTKLVHEMVFSFSPAVWDDLMNGHVVVQDQERYYVIKFNNTEKLPQGHQRSVLIKNFVADVVNITAYERRGDDDINPYDYYYIQHFKKNANNHTKSDWNNIGIRVYPSMI